MSSVESKRPGCVSPPTLTSSTATGEWRVASGEWRVIGTLDLGDGLCVACDPSCDDPVYRVHFKVTPGSYVAEVFDFTYPHAHTDVLGLRIRRQRAAITGDAGDSPGIL
jgi:hypothetical protein